MKPVLIAYTTREGHTHKIAGPVSESLAARDYSAAVIDVADIELRHKLDQYSGVVIVAGARAGRHEPVVIDFASANRGTIEGMPAAVLSLNLPEPGLELPVSTAIDRAKAAGLVAPQLEHFFSETQWQPPSTRPVSGALILSRYGWLAKWLMRSGRDWTDWKKLDDFVDTFVSKELSPTFKFKTL